jgi:formate-dependent nitrite reductase membrane component NrfD
MVAMFALMVTGALLVWDLEHPERFWMVLLKPQWRSWLVRGGFVITAYGGLLAAHLGASWMGRADITPSLGWLGGPLAAMTAIYTAYLFAQARARDLWQSPLLPAHLLVQALVAGAGALMLIVSDPSLSQPIIALFRLSLVGHLVMVLGEGSMRHPTAHATLAAKNMTRGAYAHFYWVGLALALLALVFAVSTPVAAALAGLAGLLLYEHAFVQAGQSVPLA